MPSSPDSRRTAKRLEMRVELEGEAVIWNRRKISRNEEKVGSADNGIRPGKSGHGVPCPYEGKELRSFRTEEAGIGVHVFVAAAGEVEDDEVIGREPSATAVGRGSALDKAGDGVGGF